MERKPTEVFSTWAEAQRAVWELCLGGLQPCAGVGQLRAWSRVTGTLSDAVSASTKALLGAQEHLARACAEQVAADPRSSKVVVEGAHQAYDLVVAYAEASAETCDAWLAAMRCADLAWGLEAGSTERR